MNHKSMQLLCKKIIISLSGVSNNFGGYFSIILKVVLFTDPDSYTLSSVRLYSATYLSIEPRDTCSGRTAVIVCSAYRDG